MATDNKHYIEKDSSFKSSMDPSTQPLASYTPSDSIYSDADPLSDSSINIRFGEDQEFITGEGLKFYWVRCSYRRRREAILGCIVGVLLVVCIILSVFLGDAWARRKTGSNNNVLGVICEDPMCYNYAAHQLKMFDKSVKPCDNIYQYSCGHYYNAFPTNADEFRVNIHTITWKNEENELRNLIEAPLESSYNISRDDAISKTRKIFHKCLQSDQQAHRHCGENPILEIISKVGGWKLLGTWNESNWSFDVAHRKIAIDYYITTFFHFETIPDPDNNQEIVLLITPNTRIFYTNIADMQVVGERQRNWRFAAAVANILVNEYYDDDCNNTKPEGIQKSVDSFAEEVTTIESLFAEGTSQSFSESTRMGLDELASIGPELEWPTFLSELLRHDINAQKKLFMANRKYIEKISSILRLSNISLKHNFLIWTVIKHFMTHVPGEYRQTFLQLQKELIGVKEYQPVWERCITYLSRTPLATVLSVMLTRKIFHEMDFNQITDIHNNIRDNIFANLQGLMMTDSIRKRIQEFVSNITVKIGFTELFTNTTKLDQYYSSLQVSDKHYKNAINLNRFCRDKLEESFKSQEEFPRSGLLGEIYNQRDHSLVLSPHVLQFPFYDRRLPFYSNYAGLGSFIATAYMHIILEKYAGHNMTSRFIECYSNMFNGTKIEGNVNGENYSFPVGALQPESFMEIARIKTAFQAYQMHLRKHNDLLLPSAQGVTFEQSFFISWTQLECESMDPIFQRSMASYGWLPNEIRVRIILGRYKGFQEAFNCSNPFNSPNDEKCKFLSS